VSDTEGMTEAQAIGSTLVGALSDRERSLISLALSGLSNDVSQALVDAAAKLVDENDDVKRGFDAAVESIGLKVDWPQLVEETPEVDAAE
jgi:hypothetical protein